MTLPLADVQNPDEPLGFYVSVLSRDLADSSPDSSCGDLANLSVQCESEEDSPTNSSPLSSAARRALET